MSFSQGAKKFFSKTADALGRKKTIYEENLGKETKLAKKLTILDLTSIGVGSTLGAGIYVLAGSVAKETAGPGVIISFVIAAFASMLAGLCYAEFGARVPTTGSAYVYSYFSVGEFIAFIIGWNLILENSIGTASIARAWSANLNAATGNVINATLLKYIPMNVTSLSPYPDFLASAAVLVVATFLAIGVKESATFSKIFTTVNLYVVAYCIILGFYKADIGNWEVDPNTITDPTIGNNTLGNGGFLPFGFPGVIAGAGSCFYAFIGFDAIATTGEETKNPQRAIPIGVLSCLVICTLAYVGISCAVTLACPYYLLDVNAPLPLIFQRFNWDVAKYVVSVGSIIGLSSSMLGAMFPLPRVLYAMSQDGLIFKFFGHVHPKFQTPFYSTLVVGLFAATVACLFDLQDLVKMIAIGTLLAYSLVAISVTILRGKVEIYSIHRKDSLPSEDGDSTTDSQSDDDPNIQTGYDSMVTSSYTKNTPITKSVTKEYQINSRNFFRYLFKKHSEEPTPLTEFIVKIMVYVYVFVVFFLNILLVQPNIAIPQVYIPVAILLAIAIVILISIFIQPQNKQKISFKVPFMPWTPGILVFVNIQLIMKLPYLTWIRFAVWMAIGLAIYFGYGIWHSKERSKKSEEVPIMGSTNGIQGNDTHSAVF